MLVYAEGPDVLKLSALQSASSCTPPCMAKQWIGIMWLDIGLFVIGVNNPNGCHNNDRWYVTSAHWLPKADGKLGATWYCQ